MADRIGFIGLGIMGLPMARNLAKAGYAVTVFDVDPRRMREAGGDGLTATTSPADVARASEIVVLSLPSAEVVQQVVAGPEGLVEGARKGLVVVDTTTSYPAASQAAAAALAAKGAAFLDAPVSGGDKGAIEGTLSIMVGGARKPFKRALPVLEAMGQRVVLMGEQVGAGGYAKLVNQIMVGIHLASVAEAMVFGAKAGLDLRALTTALEAGWANSAVFQAKKEKVLKRDYSPVGTVAIMHKDLSYVAKTAEELGAPVPFSRQVLAMYRQLSDEGHARMDQMFLIDLLEREAGIQVKE